MECLDRLALDLSTVVHGDSNYSLCLEIEITSEMSRGHMRNLFTLIAHHSYACKMSLSFYSRDHGSINMYELFLGLTALMRQNYKISAVRLGGLRITGLCPSSNPSKKLAFAKLFNDRLSEDAPALADGILINIAQSLFVLEANLSSFQFQAVQSGLLEALAYDQQSVMLFDYIHCELQDNHYAALFDRVDSLDPHHTQIEHYDALSNHPYHQICHVLEQHPYIVAHHDLTRGEGLDYFAFDTDLITEDQFNPALDDARKRLAASKLYDEGYSEYAKFLDHDILECVAHYFHDVFSAQALSRLQFEKPSRDYPQTLYVNPWCSNNAAYVRVNEDDFASFIFASERLAKKFREIRKENLNRALSARLIQSIQRGHAVRLHQNVMYKDARLIQDHFRIKQHHAFKNLIIFSHLLCCISLFSTHTTWLMWANHLNLKQALYLILSKSIITQIIWGSVGAVLTFNLIYECWTSEQSSLGYWVRSLSFIVPWVSLLVACSMQCVCLINGLKYLNPLDLITIYPAAGFECIALMGIGLVLSTYVLHLFKAGSNLNMLRLPSRVQQFFSSSQLKSDTVHSVAENIQSVELEHFESNQGLVTALD
tara:strand:- start:1619 stop:3409 length:1791 start_codon:yes stop_codon:yes gene_type:complete